MVLGGLDGLDYSEAFGVNDFGTIVGGAELPGGGSSAFIYTDSGGMIDLNALVSIPGWTLVSANGINDSGQVAATGVNAESEYNGCLLTPTPEPGTRGLAFSAVVGALVVRVCFCARRRPEMNDGSLKSNEGV
jgi:probable HAF family extracellular repeat protein